jgi:hypothetical protein
MYGSHRRTARWLLAVGGRTRAPPRRAAVRSQRPTINQPPARAITIAAIGADGYARANAADQKPEGGARLSPTARASCSRREGHASGRCRGEKDSARTTSTRSKPWEGLSPMLIAEAGVSARASMLPEPCRVSPASFWRCPPPNHRAPRPAALAQTLRSASTLLPDNPDYGESATDRYAQGDPTAREAGPAAWRPIRRLRLLAGPAQE